MPHRNASWWGFVATLAITGCYAGNDGSNHDAGGDGADGSQDPDDLQGPDECVDTKNFFREDVWAPLLSTKCFACHNPGGQAAKSNFVMQGTDYPGYVDANYQTVANIARLEIDGTSLLLLKPSAQIEHGGGEQIAVDGEEYELLTEMVERFDAPIHCVNDQDIRAFYADIELLDEVGTLRKAVFQLAGRMPTEIEIAAVHNKGFASLDPVLDAVMHEEAFYGRLKEIYNDVMHTDSYLVGDDAVNTVDMGRFPNARWFDALPEDQIADARNKTNDAIAREPLEIIASVVRRDRPFSEILTANFTLVNPWSARSYGVPMDHFADPNDPAELVPVTFDNFAHSGLLSTSVFLNRYPTTATNRNRARSRVFYKFFLATDVLRLAARPIDVSSIADFNPTLYNQNCTVCHDYVDPLAGAFQNFDETGRYMPDKQWFTDMRPPGFEEEQIPYDQSRTALQWLVPRLVEDEKFALSVVHTMYTGLTGQEPLLEPIDDKAPDYLQRIKAYEAQDYTFKKIAQDFAEGGHELRIVVKGLVKTEWFRATDSEVPLSPERASELADMGTAHLLSPEQLHRRIIATTGYAWKRGDSNVLLSTDFFKFFYGGIDSASVTQRLTDMNGVMANIGERMSNEVACIATANDFAKPTDQRLLFPLVERGVLPGTPEGDEAIRANIHYLHEHLLGEALDDDDPEVDRTVALFEALLNDGREKMLDPAAPLPTTIAGACQATMDATGMPLPPELAVVEDPDYTVRAWMATITYLLGDFRYLYD